MKSSSQKRWESIEARKKAAELAKKIFTGRKHSPEHIEKRKMSGSQNPMFGKIGEKHHNYGRIFPEEFREKNRQAQLRNAKNPNYLNGRSKACINTETQKVFKTVKEAAISLGIQKTTLHAMLRGNNPNRTPIQYL